MSIRYYPASKVKTNLIASGRNLYLNGKPYFGKYYETFDGKVFSGANPIVGENKELSRIQDYETNISNVEHAAELGSNKALGILDRQVINVLPNSNRIYGKPISYFPKPAEDDYRKGYITRYFIKGINQNGYITEISPSEYAKFQDGTANYNVSLYLTGQLNWKLIGPLNTVRLSQYDIRLGIIEMNTRQTQELNKTFLGIVDFIGGNYEQFARPTK